MIGRRVLSSIATTVTITGIMLTSLSTQAWAEQEQALVSGKTIAGKISEGTSRIFKFKGKSRLGDEYTFEAEPGYIIQATAVPETAAKLSIALISPDGAQTPSPNPINTTINIGGTWRLRVLGPDDDTTVRYSLGVVMKDAEGKVLKPQKPEPTLVFADQVMKNLGLSTVVCGSPELAVFTIGTETRCSTGYPKGRYVYDVATKTIIPDKPPGPLRDPNLVLLESWGLTPVSCGSSVVSIAMGTTKYCTNPTNWLTAGEYTYDSATNRLTSVSPSAQNGSSGSSPDSNDSGQNLRF